MKKLSIDSFSGYVNHIENIKGLGDTTVLFRGQSKNYPLLPAIARKHPEVNSTDIEKNMLEDLKRRSQLFVNQQFKTDWEWLTYAQHFELKTRILDWSSNPLVALWFACSNESNMKNDSYVYIFEAKGVKKVDSNNHFPFTSTETMILRPSLNNERIIAQSGWFTNHYYSDTEKRFIPLEDDAIYSHLITQICVSATAKQDIIKKLAIFGIRYNSIYPNIVGLCHHLNWKYGESIEKLL